MLTDEWNHAFRLHAHVAAHPDDLEARLAYGVFLAWLLRRSERLSARVH